VATEIVIERGRQDVARYATDPANDPVWIGGITEAQMLTDPPLAEGTRVRRVASFLGKRIEYVNEVVELRPDSLLAMRSVQSPFPMRVTYEFKEAPGGTLARIRVQGKPEGLYRLAGPAMAPAVRRSITRDLKTLKRLMESDAGGPEGQR